MNYRKFLLFLLLCLNTLHASDNVINAKQLETFGFKVNSKENAMPPLRKLLQFIKGKKDITISFPKGRYDFRREGTFKKELFISNHSDANPKSIVFLLENLDNITIDGNGSSFIFHEEMIPFEIIKSNKISIKNLRIDWERPTFSQGTIEAIGKDYFDFRLTAESWYKVENKRLKFIGEGWSQVGGMLQAHNGKTGRIKYRSGDGGKLGRGFGNLEVKELSKGLVRFKYKLPNIYNVGDVIIIRHQDRNNPGFHINQSKDTLIENVEINFSAGMGVIGQRSENITLRKLQIKSPNGKNRRMTSFADGTHFSGCKGLILVEDSRFEYMFDDAVNVHGTYNRIAEKIGPKSLKAKFIHGQSKGFVNAGPGDKVAFINNRNMLPYATLTVKQFKILNQWEVEFTFEEELPAQMRIKDGLENLTWTPKVIFRRNTIANNRARGMLFNTPQKTIVEHNYVQTSGSALLVAGDCNYWFESGAVGTFGPLIIRNNVFDQCLTNLYQFTNAQISIDPVIPETTLGGKCYHRDIFINNNVFKVFDAPIVFARSVNGISFIDNTIEQVHSFKPFHWNKNMFLFEACKDIQIKGTKLKGELLSKKVKLIKTATNEFKTDFKFDIEK